MANLEVIAIIIGILIIVTRFSGIIWPKQFISYWKRKISKESSAKTLGATTFLIGLIFVYYIWNEISLLQLLVGGFSVIMIVIGILIFSIPKPQLTILNALEKKLLLVRAMAFTAILIGILLISLGY